MASRVFSRVSRASVRLAMLAPVRREPVFHGFHPLTDAATRSSAKCALGAASQSSKCLIAGNSGLQRFCFSSSAAQPDERAPNPVYDEQQVDASNSNASEKTQDAGMKDELSIDKLVKLVAEKEDLLKLKHKEIEKMQDKVLRSYAEMENVIDRTKREAENSKKFAVQNFVKSLLDVADNLGRASSIVKESFSKLDTSKDATGVVPVLKTLLEGVEMTDKQLAEVFRKFGVERFDPVNEHFDPHRHYAVFQIQDSSKPPGTVAAVLKAGYMLYDRVIRPAEVGVTEASDNEAKQNSESRGSFQ